MYGYVQPGEMNWDENNHLTTSGLFKAGLREGTKITVLNLVHR